MRFHELKTGLLMLLILLPAGVAAERIKDLAAVAGCVKTNYSDMASS